MTSCSLRNSTTVSKVSFRAFFPFSFDFFGNVFRKKAYFSFIFQIRSDILELAGGALAGAYGCEPGKIAVLCYAVDAGKNPR